MGYNTAGSYASLEVSLFQRLCCFSCARIATIEAMKWAATALVLLALLGRGNSLEADAASISKCSVAVCEPGSSRTYYF